MISLVVRANQSVLNYSEGFVGWLLQKPKAEFIKKNRQSIRCENRSDESFVINHFQTH